MRFPEVKYHATEHDDYLELDGFDGMRRGVIFVDAAAASAAMVAGRAEVDCVAVLRGFLPLGATLVSKAAVIRAAFRHDPDCLPNAIRLASSTDYIDTESNLEARVANVTESARYDSMAQNISGLAAKPTVH